MNMKQLTSDMIPTSPVNFTYTCINEVYEINAPGWPTYDFDVYLPTMKMNLQRPLVWTDEQKQAFVIAVLQGKNFPPVSINFRRDIDVCEVIDGKQRLSTLYSYFNNEFPIVIDGVEYYYKDLDKDLDYKFRTTSIQAFVHYDRPGETHLTDEQKIAWFLYVNATGTPQQDEYISKLKDIIK